MPKQVFKCKDGSEHVKRELAELHEDQLFQQWLDSQPVVRVHDLLDTMGHETGLGWSDISEHDMLKGLIRQYWDITPVEELK